MSAKLSQVEGGKTIFKIDLKKKKKKKTIWTQRERQLAPVGLFSLF